MKKFINKFRKQPTNTGEPRELDVIQREYTELCARLGQAQYQVSIQEKEVRRLSSHIEQLSLEASKRSALKAQEASQAPAAQPSAQEGVTANEPK